MRRFWPLVVAPILIFLVAMEQKKIPGAGAPPLFPPDGRESVASRLAQYGPETRARWKPFFDRAGLSYPPSKTLLIGFKADKKLEVYARGDDAKWRWVRTLPVVKGSGKTGPKLRRGDGQVPEGFYKIESLNPNSRYHLSLRVSYPSDQDRFQAQLDGRENDDLGGDIMIHGSNQSVGCLAMGDDAAQDVFVLAADTLNSPIEVWLCPVDFRVREVGEDAGRPAWVSARYAKLKAALLGLTG